jgi:uncharacterized protein (TIGR02217 family)
MIIISAPFPERISFGARSEPEWSTELATTVAGFDAANQNWSNAKHSFDVSLAVRTADDYVAVRAHFHMTRGRAKGFLFKDPLDFEVAVAEGVCEEVEESSTGFQMFKRYGSGDDLYDRKITRPVSGTVQIFRTRGMTTSNVTGSATIDYGGDSTEEPGGTFEVSGDLPGDVYTWSGEFRVPCRYGVDRLPTAIVNKQPSADGQLFVQCDSIPVVEIRDEP